jgi:hypothetical protein
LRRFEATVQEARDARESTVGSFDVLIARTGHRTNDIMKVLTLTSVILLPGALIAGLMGMNFKIGLFEVTWPSTSSSPSSQQSRSSRSPSQNCATGSRAGRGVAFPSSKTLAFAVTT